MTRAARRSSFPFPVPAPPPGQQRPTPFPPPQLPSPDETAPVLARRVGGLPVPLFFVFGAVLGIAIGLTVFTLVRRTSAKRVRASLVSVLAVPSARAGPSARAAHVSSSSLLLSPRRPSARAFL